MTKISLTFAFVAAGAAYLLWPSSGDDASVARPSNSMVNRVWIDQMPANERDKVQVFLMLDEAPVGVFAKSSAFEGDWASFEWSWKGGLTIVMQQSGAHHSLKAKLRSGDACAPFEHCMRLEGAPRGPSKYVSMEEWVVDTQPEARGLVNGLFSASN